MFLKPTIWETKNDQFHIKHGLSWPGRDAQKVRLDTISKWTKYPRIWGFDWPKYFKIPFRGQQEGVRVQGHRTTNQHEEGGEPIQDQDQWLRNKGEAEMPRSRCTRSASTLARRRQRPRPRKVDEVKLNQPDGDLHTISYSDCVASTWEPRYSRPTTNSMPHCSTSTPLPKNSLLITRPEKMIWGGPGHLVDCDWFNMKLKK